MDSFSIFACYPNNMSMKMRFIDMFYEHVDANGMSISALPLKVTTLPTRPDIFDSIRLSKLEAISPSEFSRLTHSVVDCGGRLSLQGLDRNQYASVLPSASREGPQTANQNR